MLLLSIAIGLNKDTYGMSISLLVLAEGKVNEQKPL